MLIYYSNISKGSGFHEAWDIDPRDLNCCNAERIADNVIKNAADGRIILLHDIFKPSVDAAIIIVDELIRKGYQFITVEELLL
ncbi:MAG: hypothetical protein GX225_05475 [Clostridiales bacterium]|nr:hypothetical protein [Clostridiales bacterium]